MSQAIARHKPIVAFIDSNKVNLIDRRTMSCVEFSTEMSLSLSDALSQGGLWANIAGALSDMGEFAASAAVAAGMVIVRPQTELQFRRVSWEITEKCNFRCIHCYLDDKSKSGLAMEQRLRVLGQLESAGCILLQITGGEALADPLFEETYRAAWGRGMAVTVMTNGQQLMRWLPLFHELPPRRLRISLYGASGPSYAAMTGAPETAFENVMAGIEGALALGLRLRVAIIAAKPNQHETGLMEQMMFDRGIDFHTYGRFSPTLRGSPHPADVSADLGRLPTFFGDGKGCTGGVSSLHVHVNGKAGPCKLLPNVSVDLLSEDIQALKRLACHAGARPATPHCATCSLAGQCLTCAPVITLHRRGGPVPRRICPHFHSGSVDTRMH